MFDKLIKQLSNGAAHLAALARNDEPDETVDLDTRARDAYRPRHVVIYLDGHPQMGQAERTVNAIVRSSPFWPMKKGRGRSEVWIIQMRAGEGENATFNIHPSRIVDVDYGEDEGKWGDYGRNKEDWQRYVASRAGIDDMVDNGAIRYPTNLPNGYQPSATGSTTSNSNRDSRSSGHQGSDVSSPPIQRVDNGASLADTAGRDVAPANGLRLPTSTPTTYLDIDGE